MTPKVKIAMEQIARLRVAGIKDGVIAARLGYTQAGLSRIVALPEYQELEEAILTGVVSKMDEALSGNVKLMEKYFETTVPVALRTLFETVTQRRDLRAAMSAASEILDRDPKGTFSKKRASLNEDSPQVSTAMLDALTPDADKITKEMEAKAKASVN